MTKLIISLTFLVIATVIYSSTIIATSLYTIALPEIFSIRLLEIGKVPLTLSIIALLLSIGFAIVHIRENK